MKGGLSGKKKGGKGRLHWPARRRDPGPRPGQAGKGRPVRLRKVAQTLPFQQEERRESGFL